MPLYYGNNVMPSGMFAFSSNAESKERAAFEAVKTLMNSLPPADNGDLQYLDLKPSIILQLLNVQLT